MPTTLPRQYWAPACHVCAGVPRDEATGQGFWDLFNVAGLSAVDFAAVLASGQPFTVLSTLQSIYTTTARTLLVDFRWAGCGPAVLGARGARGAKPAGLPCKLQYGWVCLGGRGTQ